MTFEKIQITVEKLTETKWRIPQQGAMRVDGIVYASDKLMETIRGDMSLQQVVNVACLPGIVKYSIAMPDIHWGYGFPIGGVAAFDAEDGVISPGGVGYDINCGVRLMRSNVHRDAIRGREDDLVAALFRNIPTGVGAARKDLRLSKEELKNIAAHGARWALQRGFGEQQDLERIEEHGCLEQADPDAVGEKAYGRGQSQLGTLGSGNHFCEVGFVEEIFDEPGAKSLGLIKGNLAVIIHTGSRGFGHQICEDYLDVMDEAIRKFGIALPDRQLACAPLTSPEAERYLAAMACGANFAFCNRQLIAHQVRESFEQTLGMSPKEHGLHTVYDVPHNIAKMEKHDVDGKQRLLCVHRKGATRAFPPGHPETPEVYRSIGQPVLIPGDMGRYSYVLLGTEQAYKETWGSSCHGAGRMMSRHEAKKLAKGRRVLDELKQMGIHIMADGMATVVEEMPEAYKDVAEVVETVHRAGIGKKVAKLHPVCVIKG